MKMTTKLTTPKDTRAMISALTDMGAPMVGTMAQGKVELKSPKGKTIFVALQGRGHWVVRHAEKLFG